MRKKLDIQGHILLLKHAKLSEQASEDLLKKYNIAKEKLPVISASDPAIDELNAESGDIIEISRNSPTTGTSKYYRVVIHG
ncbi:MAG: DNA-directed RNA polymerase subunit H [Nanoarchaeota archaeon]|nr:DNA-directed RNA polymerase subunit H [Nanoarchaeota archaeon]